MNVGLGWYQPGASWLHRLDPRPKLAFVLLANVALVSASGIAPPLAALVLVQVGLFSARIAWRRIARVWRAVAPLMLVILLLQPLLTPGGDPLVELWILRITPQGLERAASLALRLAALAFSWYVLLLTTRETHLVQALVRLGMPASW